MTSPLPSISKPRRLSPFFRDLASPISAHHHHRSATSRLASSVPWRETDTADDPPPPPAFTLDDRADHSPEPMIGDLPSSPSPPPPVSPAGSNSRTPLSSRLDRKGSLSPSSSFVLRSRGEGSGSGSGGNGAWKSPEGSTSWMATLRVGGDEPEKRAGSPVDGVVEQGVVMALSRPGAVARLDLPENGVTNGSADEEACITVFGFAPVDTNLVLREFEKCGVVLKHIPGPRDANWIHIFYQNHYDARKALQKDGMHLNSRLIIGVKPIDPIHRQLLNDALNSHRGSFIPSKLVTHNSLVATSSSGIHPRTGTSAITDNGRRPTGAIAAPARSVVSKVVDLIFGI